MRQASATAHHEEETRVAPVFKKFFIGQKHQRVPFVIAHLAHIVHQEALTIAANLQNGGAILCFEVEIKDMLTYGREARAQHYIDAEIAGVFARQLCCLLHRATVRQEPMGEEEHINNTSDGYKASYFAQLKHGEPWIARIHHHPIDNKICGRTYQRTHTAKNRGIAQGDEKLSSRETHRFGPALDNRGKNNDNWCVIEKSRDGGNDRQEAQLNTIDRKSSLGQ